MRREKNRIRKTQVIFHARARHETSHGGIHSCNRELESSFEEEREGVVSGNEKSEEKKRDVLKRFTCCQHWHRDTQSLVTSSLSELMAVGEVKVNPLMNAID